MPPTTTFRDYLLMHVVVVSWGLTAILGKLIELPAVDVAVWRTGLASVVFAYFAYRNGGFQVGLGVVLRYAAVGGMLGIHWVLFFHAARLATASVCLAAMPTAMLWCSLMEPLIDGTRRWRPLELLVGLVMVGAVWIIYQVEFSHWWGFTVAIISALFAAFFATMSKQVVSQHHWGVIGFYQMTGAFVAAFVCRPIWEPGVLPALPEGWSFLWLSVLALLCTVAAYIGFIKALRTMSVFSMNVIYNMEPVYGIILAALVFGSSEFMSPGFYVGTGIIIGSVVLLPWLRRRIECRS